MFIGMGTDFWGNAIYTLPTNQPMLEAEWLEASTKLIPLIFSFSGVFFAFIHYIYTFDSLYYWKTSFVGKYLYTFLNRKWFFDKIYNEWISQPILQFAYTETYKNIDRGILEFLGPNGISIQIYGGNTTSNNKKINTLNSISNTISELSLGFIFGYLFIMFVTLFVILFIISIWTQIGFQLNIILVVLLLCSLILLNMQFKKE
jgi:NADH-ubiquinone oxidoreductase chain 5